MRLSGFTWDYQALLPMGSGCRAGVQVGVLGCKQGPTG